MSVLLRSLRREGVRDGGNVPLSLDQYLSWFTYNGLPYAAGLGMGQQTLAGNRQEEITDTFEGLVSRAYKANGIVFACVTARMRLFSEARFQFRRYVNGRPGDYFGSPALLPLEQPAPNVTTGDLLSRMEQDISLAGNAYIARGAPAPGTDWPTLRRLRPDWVTIVGGSRRRPRSENPLWESDVEVIGYVYHPGGYGGGDVELFMRDGQGELPVAHWAPTPDPDARFRGMSWLTPIVREVMADQAFTQHKLMYIEQGATPNLVVSLSDQLKPSEFASWIEAFDEQHEGLMNAYKTIYLGGGADVSVVGNNLQQLDFRNVQGAGELRIAAAAGIPAAVAGIQEGVNPTYCLPAGERVWTLDGPRSIADIRPGDMVWSSDEGAPRPSEVTWQGCVGEKMVYEVRTKNRALLATANHPVLVRVPGHRGGVGNSGRAPSLEWRAVGELRPGDCVVEALSLPDTEGVQPEWASLELAQWLGAYVGDGDGAGKHTLRISMPPNDRVREHYERLTVDLFDGRIQHYNRAFAVTNKASAEFLGILGFAGNAKTKRLPGWVFRLPRAQRLMFLAGLMDSDGSVDKRGVGSFTLCNRELVEQVRALFVSCGIQVSNVRHNVMTNPGRCLPGQNWKQPFYEAWGFAITTGLGEVPTADPLYQQRLTLRRDAREGGDAWKTGIDPTLAGFFTVRSITPRGVEPVYDISVRDSRSFFAGGVAVHNSNYGEAKAAFADMTMRPLWRNAANSLQSLIAVPGGADLWYDDRDIPFLRDSIKERQDVVASQATTITTLIMQGFTAESAVQAVVNGDMTMLVHTGLVSVQLHDPSQPPAPPPLNPGSANGQGAPNGVPAPPA